MALNQNTTGNYNVAAGSQTLYFNTTGSNNVAAGLNALRNNLIGNNNTALGDTAGANITTGSSNIAIGANSTVLFATGSNQLSIGNWIYGTSGNIGIGTGTALTAKLTVAGQVQITGGSPGAGKVLTSDATGLATWQSAALSGWGLTGNAGTTAGTNFLGTTDNIDVVFKRNNIEGMRLSGSSGNLVTIRDITVAGSTIGLGG